MALTKKLKEEVMTSPPYKEELLSSLYGLYEEQLFCDITLQLDENHTVLAHRAVLIAASPVFRSMVESDESNTYFIPDISLQEMRAMLQFIYTGTLQVTSDTVNGVFNCANSLQINQASMLCQNYLEKIGKDFGSDHDELNTMSPLLSREDIKKETEELVVPESDTGISNITASMEYSEKSSESVKTEDNKPQVFDTILRIPKTRLKLKKRNVGGGKVKPESAEVGRKRTLSVVLCDIKNSMPNEEPLLKRKRGRPRKNENQAKVQPKVPPRPCIKLKLKAKRNIQALRKKDPVYKVTALKKKPTKTNTKNVFGLKKDSGFKCEVCKGKYRSKTVLKYHKLTHHLSRADLKKKASVSFQKKLVQLYTKAMVEKARVLIETKTILQRNCVSSTNEKGDGQMLTDFLCGVCRQSFQLKNRCLSHIFKKHLLKVPCLVCKAKFPSLPLYLLHCKCQKIPKRSSLTPKKPRRRKLYKCPISLRYFKHKTVLKRNARKVLKQLRIKERKAKEKAKWASMRRMTCQEGDCQQIFHTLKQINEHMVTEHPNVQYMCTQSGCKFKTKLKVMMAKHQRSSHGANSHKMCEICGKTFSKTKVLKLHKFSKHKVVDPSLKVFSCSKGNCKYTCATERALQLHMNRHNDEKPFTCDLCGKSLKTAITLEKHISRMHMGIKPYICDKCGAAYTEEAELRIHYVRHNEIKAFRCSMCEYCTHDKGNYQSHLFARHEVIHDEGMQIQTCNICDFKTNVKKRFRDHMKVHLNIRDIPCPDCGKLFVTNKTLYSHMTKVHKPKTFKCAECHFAATTSGKLKEHVRLMHTHRNYKPYKCSYCRFLCASGGNCRKHIMRKHPGLDVKYIKLTEEEFNAIVGGGKGGKIQPVEYRNQNWKHYDAEQESMEVAKDQDDSYAPNATYTALRNSSATDFPHGVIKESPSTSRNDPQKSSTSQLDLVPLTTESLPSHMTLAPVSLTGLQPAPVPSSSKAPQHPPTTEYPIEYQNPDRYLLTTANLAQVQGLYQKFSQS